jgi:hypothetical protein
VTGQPSLGAKHSDLPATGIVSQVRVSKMVKLGDNGPSKVPAWHHVKCFAQVTTSCNHIFHEKCLNTWKESVRSEFTCPLCREKNPELIQPIVQAAERGDVLLIKRLLADGADVQRGWFALDPALLPGWDSLHSGDQQQVHSSLQCTRAPGATPRLGQLALGRPAAGTLLTAVHPCTRRYSPAGTACTRATSSRYTPHCSAPVHPPPRALWCMAAASSAPFAAE